MLRVDSDGVALCEIGFIDVAKGIEIGSKLLIILLALMIDDAY